MNLKTRYLSSAFLLLMTSIIVKIIGAVYKIPLTMYIGAVGRGYFATAYNLCMPIHIITMGAFPIALSKLVSTYNAKNDKVMIVALRVASSRLFFVVGLIGMAIMLAFAVPYCKYIANAPKSIYTVLVLAPSILLSSMAGSFRGYYEGFMNMVPTSVSQTIEALAKLVFGLVFSRLAMSYLFSKYVSMGYSNEEVLSMSYPFTSAFAILGVTFGAFVSLAFVWIYYLINREKSLSCQKEQRLNATKELLSFSFPIMISSAVQSVFQFLDTATIQYSLNSVHISALKNQYYSALSFVSLADSDVPTYVYGLFNSALDFKNLVPGITMALGVCAVPAVSRAFELGDSERVESLVNSVFKYSVILSSMGGVALCYFSKDILALFYGGSSLDVVFGCSDLVSAFAVTLPLYSLAGSAVFVNQALGKPEKSIMPYVLSGVVRVVLNLWLIKETGLILFGAVVSGAVGYLVICVWNIAISKVKIDYKSVVILPTLVSVGSYFSVLFAEKIVSTNFSPVFDLLIRLSIFVSIYCILCFLCGLLNFRQIFCAIKLSKKSSKPLKNGQKYSNI